MLFDPFEYVVGVIINRFFAGCRVEERPEEDDDDFDGEGLDDRQEEEDE